jgi:hypothetical protein
MRFIGKEELPNDRCDFDLPIPSMKLQLAVSGAFETLGQPAKDSLLVHLRSQGIDLDDGSQRTLNQLNAALEPIFSKEATVLIMEVVWNFLRTSLSCCQGP